MRADNEQGKRQYVSVVIIVLVIIMMMMMKILKCRMKVVSEVLAEIAVSSMRYLLARHH